MTTINTELRNAFMDAFGEVIDRVGEPTEERVTAAIEALGLMMVSLWVQASGIPATRENLMGVAHASHKAMAAWADASAVRN